MNAISGTVSSIWSSISNGIGTTIGNIYNTIKGGFDKAVDFIKGLASSAWNWGADIINCIKSCIGKVKDAVSNVAETIKNFLHFSAEADDMAFIQYLNFDGTDIPLPDSFDVEVSDVVSDAAGEKEAGTTQRDVVRSGVVSRMALYLAGDEFVDRAAPAPAWWRRSAPGSARYPPARRCSAASPPVPSQVAGSPP